MSDGNTKPDLQDGLLRVYGIDEHDAPTITELTVAMWPSGMKAVWSRRLSDNEKDALRGAGMWWMPDDAASDADAHAEG